MLLIAGTDKKQQNDCLYQPGLYLNFEIRVQSPVFKLKNLTYP